jgi:YYY domain-containing protein
MSSDAGGSIPEQVPNREPAVAGWLRLAALGKRAFWRWQVGLAAILLVGGAFRFHGLGWDQPAGTPGPLQMHPDERFLSLVSAALQWPSSIGAYFDTAKSTLNPYNDPNTHSYVYGTFPLFLARAVSSIAGGASYDTTVVWGRRLTALTDTATIAVVFALGRTLFNRRVGLLAAAFYALAVLPTQLAHFWTMDPYVTFFGALTLFLSALMVTAERPMTQVALTSAVGIAIGLGLASKVTAWPIALGPAFVLAARIGMRNFPSLGLRWRGQSLKTGHWEHDLAMFAGAALLAFAVFRVAQPYAFAGPHIWNITINPQWRSDILREIDFQNGNADFPPFIQFAGRTPILRPLEEITMWGLGPQLSLAGWLSAAVAAFLVFRRRQLTFALPLVYFAAIFGFQGPRFVAFMRYFEPLYPVLCLFAAWGCVALLQRTGGLRLRRLTIPPGIARDLAVGAVVVVVGATVWWACAFQSIYFRTHTRIEASQWIYANIPPGSSISYELWDDSVPYTLPGREPAEYHMVETTPYDPDSTAKIHALVYGVFGDAAHPGLDHVDYIAITSNRVSESVKRLPAKYPATVSYYQLLDSGALGFQRVATFQNNPTFLGLSIDDQSAEESFTVYDHPEVRIYKKTPNWNADAAFALLENAHPERATYLLPRQGGTNGLELIPSQAATQQSGGTFSQIFDARGWASHLPWVWWLVFLEIASVASLPWLTWLCRALPDRGYGLSKVAGLSSIVLPTWLLVAWGGPHFSGGLVWIVFAVVFVAGMALGYRRREALLSIAHQRWRTWLVMEATFLVAFFAFLLLRAFNPDLWYVPQGGEKPMEMAYLTAVARSTTLPPYDPWFAGGTMNYYYMGWFFLAVPMRAFRLLPEITFNLGVPTFAALAASCAFSTAHNLVALASRALPRDSSQSARRYCGPVLAGIFGAILLIAIGNLDGATQLIDNFQTVSRVHLASGIPFFGGLIEILGGAWRWAFEGARLAPFDWWRSSRVHLGTFDITEFPYWTFLFSDLHPHLMDLPFFGLTIALVLAYVASARMGMRLQSWALAAALGTALGLVRMIHTWDFPTAVIMVAGGIFLGQLLAPGRWQERWWNAVGHLALAAGVLEIAFSPFSSHFETFNTGVVRAPETTRPQHYFTHFGVFVALGILFLIVRYHEEAKKARGTTRNPVVAMVAGPWEFVGMAVFTAGLSILAGRFGLTVVALSLIAEVFLFNLLWLELRDPDPNIGRLVATAMFALAIGIAAGTDVVTLKDDIVRMNTVFKFLIQAWQLFALASAFAAWYSLRYLWQADGWRVTALPGRRAAAWTATTLVAALLAGASIFIFLGTPARENARFASTPMTLNGLAYLPGASYRDDHGTDTPTDDATIHLGDDAPLIQWLRDNVKGSPVVAEAVGPLYHWTGRITWTTGLPAVIGWDWHQIQQRGDYASLVTARRTDTVQFFSDPDVGLAEKYLRKYNVSFVVVGTTEQVYGTPDGLEKFGRMPELTKVFSSGPYAIYAVDQSKLPIQ